MMLTSSGTLAVGVPLWLLWLDSGSAGVVPLRRALEEFVFRGDSRNASTIQASGGFQPQGDRYWESDTSFDFSRHQEGIDLDSPDARIEEWQTAFVSTSVRLRRALDFTWADESNAGYVYHIHATPNMFRPADADFEAEQEIPALGGIPWSAVAAYAQLRENCTEVDQLLVDGQLNADCWTTNPAYREAWSQFSMAAAPPATTADGNHRTAAINFLNEVGAPLGWVNMNEPGAPPRWQDQFPLSLSFENRLQNAGIDQALVARFEPQGLLESFAPPYLGSAELACAQLFARLAFLYPSVNSVRPRGLAAREQGDDVEVQVPASVEKSAPAGNCTALQDTLARIQDARDAASVCSGPRAHGLYPTSAGRPLVEVLSVRMNNINNESPGDLYGTIVVTDDQGPQHLYNRAQADHENIWAGNDVALTGPSRAISAAKGFVIDLDLADYDGGSADDEVSKGEVRWDAHDAADATPCETLISREVDADSGSVTVNYVIMDAAAAASVEIILQNADDENRPDVYGHITASTRFGRRDLFRKSQGQYVRMLPNSAFDLARPVMAVPMDDILSVNVTLMEHDKGLFGFFRKEDEIAKRQVEFWPEFNTSARRIVTGNKGSIEIRVTWS